MDMRELAATLAELYGPTGREIAQQIRALPVFASLTVASREYRAPLAQISITRDIRQAAVESWVRNAFGPETMLRPDERAARVLEEATELAQACGVPQATAQKITGYVYARPVGDPAQEAGGVGLTLLACCGTLGLSADAAEQTEVERVLARPLEHWSRRWKEKSAAGITPGIRSEDRSSAGA